MWNQMISREKNGRLEKKNVHLVECLYILQLSETREFKKKMCNTYINVMFKITIYVNRPHKPTSYSRILTFASIME